MIMSVMIQERQEIYLLGEFLSCTVNAVTVISITNSSEVLDTIATVRIGCWGSLTAVGEAVGAGVNLKQVAGSDTSFSTPAISPVPNLT